MQRQPQQQPEEEGSQPGTQNESPGQQAPFSSQCGLPRGKVGLLVGSLKEA